ncbi:hypothetical protein [Virgisporangium ochraceum]|nr:hypothetical protein [Virgisporangium ochraceum]
MPRVRTLLAVAALMLATSTACGGEDDADRGSVAAATWAGAVCSALGPWRTEIDSLMTRAQQRMDSAANADQAKTGLLELLGGAENASEQARSKVAAAGVPDAENGRQAAKEFADTLRRTRDAYGKAKEKVTTLQTGDSTKFYDGVSAAFKELEKDYSAGALNLDKVKSKDLQKAFDEVEACR